MDGVLLGGADLLAVEGRHLVPRQATGLGGHLVGLGVESLVAAGRHQGAEVLLAGLPEVGLLAQHPLGQGLLDLLLRRGQPLVDAHR